MKKILLLLTLFCTLFMGTARATDVEIGDPSTATGSTYLPFYTLYNYGISQQIYTAEEIGMAGTINSLTLWLYNGGTNVLPTMNISIYMKEVDRDAFASTSDWEALTENDLVYSSNSLTVTNNAAQEYEFTLDNPFVYSGTGNLLIAIFNNTGTYKSGLYGLVFTATGQALSTQRDASAYSIAAPGVAGTSRAFKNVIALGIAGGGGGPTCEKPETADITDVTSNSATLTISGGSQTYNVEIKGANDADWTFVVKNTTSTTLQLTDLAPNTSYQVRVQSVCEGDPSTSGYKTASFKTLIGIPYSDGLGTQGDWTKKQGLLSDILAGGAFGTAAGSWNFGTRNNVLGEPHAYMNLYGTSCKNWIISPMIPLPEGGNYVLTYTVALTDYNNANPVDNLGNQPDDKLVVLISADSCQTWSILQQWDNEGSPYVYDEIPTTGEEVEIDLSAYAGQGVQIAFYGESTTSNGDNDIHVGRVLIDRAPSCMTPDGLAAVAANTTKTSVQLDWNAKNDETAWILEYKKPADSLYTSIDINQKPYTLLNLEEFTEYNVRIAGKCSDEEDGTSKFCKPVTIKTASGVPFVQSFDSILPSEWQRYEALLSDVLNEGASLEASKKGWTVTAANEIFSSADNHLVLNLTEDASKYWLVGPTIEMVGEQQLTFDLAFTKATGNKQAVESGTQNSQKFYVFISTNGGATWNDVAKWTNAGEGFSLDGINTEGTTAKIDLTAYATNSIQIAFYGESTNPTDASNNLHIANVKIDSIPACSKPTSLNITGIKGTTATAVWESEEDGLWEYGYAIKPDGEFVAADSLFMDTTYATTFEMSDLTENTHYMFFVRRVCGNTTSDALVKEFATIQTPTDLPYQHDFETGNGWRLINGDLENHWVWNEAEKANNTPNGSKALYISNDAFGTYAYTKGSDKAAMVYAVKTFYFDQAGMYSFQYDWKCYGYSTSDFMRVALIPADVELEAATTLPTGLTYQALPEGWTALDGGSRLNLDSAWNHELVELTIDKAGYYQMVFAWRNGTYTYGKNPPAAVDNIKIARIRCTKPSHLTYADVTATGVTFNWDAVDGASFDYAIVAADDSASNADPAFIEVPDGANSIQLTDLLPQTAYNFYLRKACGGEDGNSDAISIEVTTECLAYSLADHDGVYAEGFEAYEGVTYSAKNGVTPDCWATGGTSTYAAPHVVVSGGSYAWAHEGTKGLNFCASASSYAYAMLPIFAEDLNTLQIKFWARMENATNGTLSLCYITDDSESFQQIAVIPSVTGTMTQHEVILDAVPDNAKRLVFLWNHSGSSYYSCCIDDILVEEIPSCMKPTDLAVIDTLTTTNSVAITWTPGLNETNWLVQYKRSADTVWTFVPDSVLTDTLLVLAGLEAANSYDVRVAAWCNTADSTAISEYSAAIVVATLCEPYSIAESGDFVEDFEAYVGVAYNAKDGVAPVCWEAGGTSTYGAPHVVVSGGSYAWAHEGTKGLNFCASANSYTYAVLPEFVDSLKFLQISFWAQMENATNGVLYLGYVDDSLAFNALTSYANHTGSMAYYETKLDTIPDAARRLAFVWQRDGSSYYSCCIDDITIKYIPNCQKPENVAAIDSLATANSVTLKWDAQGEETAWVVQYKEVTDSVWTTIAADTDSAFVIDGLKAATYYDVQVAALCGATDTSEYSIPITVHTGCAIVAEFPYNENFDIMEGKTSGKNLPLCWSQINVGTNTTYNYYPMVYKGTTYANSGTNSLKFYSYYSSTAATTVADQYAILPEMEGISALRLRFNARKYSASYDATFTVGVMTDPEDASTYVALDTITPSAATYEPFKVLFNAYEGAGKHIAIKMDAAKTGATTRGFYLDDIVVDSIPNCLEPDSLQAVLTKGQGSIATLKWAAGAASAWEVQYGMDAEFADAVTANVNEPTINLTGLTSDSTYYARVKAICGENEESEWSNAISFTPMNAIVVNDGTITNSYVPFYGTYVDDGSNSQFIIPAKEIATIQWDSITKLTFFASTASATWAGTQFDVYVMETADTVLNSMVAWTSMTKVVNSKHLELANKQMVVTLDKPFQYEGGNLLIGFKQTVLGTYSSCSWYGKSGVSGNSIYQYASNAESKSNFNPKVKIDHVHGEMPTCFVVKDIAVSDITASSAVLNWTKGTEDQNAWQVVYSADPAFDLANVTAEDIHDVAALPYAIADLATETLYKVYVRANCSDEENEDYSAWSELITFQTASACQTPSDIVFSDITATSVSISWNTYGQTGFNLLYSDGTATDTIYNVESPYVLTGLTAKTSYGVKVQAACAAENVWSQIATFKTAYGVPFEEKFATTSQPADWNRYSGLLSDVLAGSASLTTTTSGWNFNTGNGVFDNHAKINIYGTTYKYWLVTPAVAVEGDVQLSFDLALTKFSGTLQPVVDTLQQDDKFVVLISEDNGATWSILRQWDNAGSEYVYNNIACSAEGEQIAISLAAYSGKGIKIAFYGESTETGGDNNLHIDNVLIDLVPTCLKPTGLNISEVKAHTAKIAWTAEEGQNAWQIAYATMATEKPDTLANILDVTENPYVLADLDPVTTYYVYVRANCGEQDGMSKWTDGKSFKTMVACPAPKNLMAELVPGVSDTATLTWTAGGDEAAWRVEYSTNADMSDSIVIEVEDTIYGFKGLTAETTYYVRVLADCGELDSLSAYSAVVSFTPTTAYLLTVNEGATTNSYVPIYGNWVDNYTRSQFIIPAADIEELEWDSIKSLTFYASSESVNWGAAQFEVYVAEAPETTMSDLTDWDAMTKVMNAASLSIVDNQMVVTFDEAYQYQGGHLLIGFSQTVSGTYKAVNWYGVSASKGASMGGYGTSINQQSFLPKMTIEYAPGVPPACPNPKNLQVLSVAADSASFSWKAVNGASWEYAVALADAAEPTEFNAVPEGANTIVVNGLDELTSYVFYLRRACGENGNSEIISVPFTTLETAQEISTRYDENFEAATGWKLFNGTETNAWIIGNDTYYAGENALYISNDGASYDYDDEAASVTYATKLFNFVSAGNFIVSYYYKCEGEYDEDDGALDYMRAALIPADEVITAGVQPEALGSTGLPTGWIALDKDTALVNQGDWTLMKTIVTIPTTGLYRLAFIWTNDGSASDGVPAAIDNISISHKDYPTGIESGAGIETNAVKIIRDNHVYILVNGNVYDITGRKVELK